MMVPAKTAFMLTHLIVHHIINVLTVFNSQINIVPMDFFSILSILSVTGLKMSAVEEIITVATTTVVTMAVTMEIMVVTVKNVLMVFIQSKTNAMVFTNVPMEFDLKTNTAPKDFSSTQNISFVIGLIM